MPRPKRYNASQGSSTTITDDEGESKSPANVLLKLRESTSAADLSKLDKFGLEPELSQRVATFADDFNAADMRNICTEGGMFAIRDERDYVVHDDFMKAVRKLAEAKKLEPTASYDDTFKNTD